MKICYLLALLALSAGTARLCAQEINSPLQLPDGLRIANQLKYSYDTNLDRQIFEDWLNLDYRYGVFKTGMRFEAFQPNDPNPAVFRGKPRYADIAYKYVAVTFGGESYTAELTAGNFYALFGRGAAVRSYEDRNVRIDNNLTGIKAAVQYGPLQAQLLSGMAENSDGTRTDVLHAADLEYFLPGSITAGFTAAMNQPQNNAVAKTVLLTARAQGTAGFADFYTEYGVKKNTDIQAGPLKNNSSIAGKLFYASVGASAGGFYITGEYKYYDNFTFASYDGSVQYNTPPAARKDYSYGLLNRHPSPLDQSNEQGYQAEAAYHYGRQSFILLNINRTRTLGPGSLFGRISGSTLQPRVQLQDYYLQHQHSWSRSLKTGAAFNYNEELSTNTRNYTPVLEAQYSFGGVHTLHAIAEHQQTRSLNTMEDYYTDAITLEYLHSPAYSISMVSELQAREPEKGRTVRKFWSFVQAGYRLGEHTDVSLLIGSRQAGNICIGGVCRYEPAFSGIELKIFSRF